MSIVALRKGDQVLVRVVPKSGRAVVGRLTPDEARALAARLLIAADEETEELFRAVGKGVELVEKGKEALDTLGQIASRLRLA